MPDEAHDHDGLHHPPPAYSLPRFGGGRRLLLVAAVVGVLGLALTAFGGIAAPDDALLSYLTAFIYWLGIALGGLLTTMAFNAAHGRWMIVLRRGMETTHAPMPAFVLLFLPILFFARRLFIWIDPPASLSHDALRILAGQHIYLNFNFFIIRAVLYFTLFVGVSLLLWTWSNRQDSSTDPAESARLTRLQRRLSAGALPLVCFFASFASFDWLLSLNPLYYSTLFGIYFLAGAFLGGIALLVLISALLRHQPGTFGPYLSLAHFHNLGKLLLALVAFWAYIAFSQFMLTWHANLPAELPWYLERTTGPWKPVWLFLIFGNFLVPFFLLLSRDLKLRPRPLAVMAAWLLLGHFIDTWWLVVPTFHPHHIHFHWTQVTALLGIGGVVVAFALSRARGRFPIPIGDPYLPDSLGYTQP